MSSAVFWKTPPWRHLIAVPQVNCSTRRVHWPQRQNSCRRRLSVCAEQTAGTHSLADRRCERPVVNLQYSDRYAGANPWRHSKTRTAVLKSDPLPDWQPVKFPHHRCDVVEFSGSSDQASSSVLEWLQLIQQPTSNTNKELVTVI